MSKHALLCGVALATLLVSGARANTVAITLTGYTDYTNGQWTLGFEFSPTVNVDVTALGSFFPVGADDVHGVTLWNAGETVLATTTVTGTGTEGFDYTAITPVLLLAGQDYVIGANTLTDDYADEIATWTTAADINYIQHQEVLCTGVTPCYPTNLYPGTSFGDFGANFQFTPATVPEPSSIALVGTGMAVLGWRVRKRRREV